MLRDVLKKIRKMTGLNQKQFAEKVGIAANTMQQYESGKRGFSFDKLVYIAEKIGMSKYDLLNEIAKDPDYQNDSATTNAVRSMGLVYYDAETGHRVEYNHFSGELEINEHDYDDYIPDIIRMMNTLTDDAQQKVYDYITDLAKIDEYKIKK